MIEEDGVIRETRPIRVPLSAWLLVAMAAVSVAIGTFARDFPIAGWYVTADRLVRALELALPFLVAAGVVIGAGRWPAAGRWFVTGVIFMALAGVLAVVSEVLLGLFVLGTTESIDVVQSALPIVTLVGTMASAIGFAALAVGLWRSESLPVRGPRVAIAVGIGLVTVLSAAAPLATTATATSVDGVGYLPWVIAAGLGVMATGALAIAAVLATTARAPLPEVLIACGATVTTLATGGWWWLLGASAGPALELLVALRPIPDVALIVLAGGFASGALFWPVDDEGVTLEAAPSA